MEDKFTLSISIRNLRYVVAAAEAGNITAAARRLHVSQPAVSMAIAAIEAHYGRRLFSRTRGQAISITSFGRSFLKQARDILERSNALAHLGASDSNHSGEVRLGCFTDLAPFYVPKLLKEFSASFPGIIVDLRDAGLDVLPEKLCSGEIDLAFTYELGLHSRIDRVPLLSLAPYLMLPHDHPLTRRKKITLEHIARYPLVLTDQALSWQHFLAFLPSKVNLLMRASSFEMQRSLVANGLGIGIAYTRPLVDRSYDGAELAIRDIADCRQRQSIVLAWAKESALTAAGRAFCEFTKSAFANDRHFEKP